METEVKWVEEFTWIHRTRQWQSWTKAGLMIDCETKKGQLTGKEDTRELLLHMHNDGDGDRYFQVEMSGKMQD